MGFPRRLLADHEDLVLDLRPHWIALVPPAIVTALILAGTILVLVYMPDSWPSFVRWLAAVVAIVLFVAYPLRTFVAWATSHFVVTTDRVIHRAGWLAKSSMEIPLENVNDVRFVQSVFERLIGAGDLILESAGEYGQNSFTDIRKPEQVQKTIYEMSEANQRRMIAPGGPSPLSTADELAKLSRLRDQGVLTEAEYQAQKDRLLGTQ